MKLWMTGVCLVLCALTVKTEAVEDRTIPANGPPRVTVETGELEGVSEGALHVFKGIPYAAPPVGELRWRAPQPPRKWTGILQARDYGAICPQKNVLAPQQDEDCLFLNVWAPADRREAPYPVMVWIHGGGFVNGSGKIPGENFAKRGVVFVSFNYRLGRFGSFAHPALSAARPEGEPPANCWLLDQIAALHWIQRNIAQFGGDPSCVTIFGVSAGGASVNVLMASPLAKGLFHRAIAQSSVGGYGPYRRLDVAHAGLESQFAAGEEFAESQRVHNKPDVAAALRALPWRTVARLGSNADDRNGIGPVVDGISLLDDVQQIFEHGRQHNVPFIAGANSFEGSLASAYPWKDQPPKSRVMANLDRLAPLYGRAPDDPALLLDIYGDVFFRASALYLVDQMKNVPAPAWNYYFDHVIESLHDQTPDVGHGGEVMYVFDSLPESPFKPGMILAAALKIKNRPYPIVEADREVSRFMQGHWIQFAKTGNPNGPGLPEWPSYSASTPVTLVYGQEEITAVRDLDKGRFDVLFKLLEQVWLSQGASRVGPQNGEKP